MKAHINGITVEGTPQEIMEYQRLKANKVSDMLPNPQYPYPSPYETSPWWGIFPPDTIVPRITGTATTPDYLKYPTVTTSNYTEICINN